MPPSPALLAAARRADPLKQLALAIQTAEHSDIAAHVSAGVRYSFFNVTASNSRPSWSNALRWKVPRWTVT